MLRFERLFLLHKKTGRQVEAYELIFETLDWLASDPQRDFLTREESHITGQQLTEAVFQFSLHNYGMMAKMVWKQLGIEKSEDIGDIIYELLDEEIMYKQDDDSKSDFDNVLTINRFDEFKVEATSFNQEEGKFVLAFKTSD